jgi:hypothetical protein
VYRIVTGRTYLRDVGERKRMSKRVIDVIKDNIFKF